MRGVGIEIRGCARKHQIRQADPTILLVIENQASISKHTFFSGIEPMMPSCPRVRIIAALGKRITQPFPPRPVVTKMPSMER